MDFIRRFFGLPNTNQHFNETYPYHEDEIKRMPNPPYEDDPRHGFNEAQQMHQYFENQINKMLNTFGFQSFGDGFFSEFSGPDLEMRTKLNDNDNYSDQLRNQFLKNGYERPSQKQSDKADKDIDEKVNIGDLDSVFGKKNNVRPYKESGGFFFGKSQSMRTIRNADGSIETHRTVRDNEGNEETTVCHKIGDKEYCIVKKKDKHGSETVTENFTNMTENEKEGFLKPKITNPIIDRQENDFPFDNLFR